MIPVQTGDGVTAVSLKSRPWKKEKGWVDILFDTNKLGKVAASFQAKEDGVSGMIAVDEEDTQMFLSEHLDTLTEALREGTDAETKNIDIKIAYVSDLSLEHYETSQITREARLKKKKAGLQQMRIIRYRQDDCIILQKVLFSRYRSCRTSQIIPCTCINGAGEFFLIGFISQLLCFCFIT